MLNDGIFAMCCFYVDVHVRVCQHDLLFVWSAVCFSKWMCGWLLSMCLGLSHLWSYVKSDFVSRSGKAPFARMTFLWQDRTVRPIETWVQTILQMMVLIGTQTTHALELKMNVEIAKQVKTIQIHHNDTVEFDMRMFVLFACQNVLWKLFQWRHCVFDTVKTRVQGNRLRNGSFNRWPCVVCMHYLAWAQAVGSWELVLAIPKHAVLRGWHFPNFKLVLHGHLVANWGTWKWQCSSQLVPLPIQPFFHRRNLKQNNQKITRGVNKSICACKTHHTTLWWVIVWQTPISRREISILKNRSENQI